jgi:hypothetical protein
MPHFKGRRHLSHYFLPKTPKMGPKGEMGLPGDEFTPTMTLILVVERWQSGLTRTPGKWMMAFALIRTHEESSILTVIFSILGLIKKD